MAEKDVDEQFAAIVAHWDDEVLGLDPNGDPPVNPATAADSTTVAPASGVDGRGAGDHVDPPRDPTHPGKPVNPVNPAAPEHVAARDAPDSRDDVDPREDVDALDATELLDRNEHYEPPPPAPLPPSDDKHFWTMIVALVAGPLMFLYLLLFNRDGNGWWMMFALMVSIAGFVLLVLRQPLEREDGDDGVRL